ncbi:hypothetical protein DASC09_021590 [Saccharomycopsis crataegensis]|uniref:Uncharacterized protein n=1 Tax=Saccharomycopsis crataegensis TaxID=43959 RepID=A0AAV5QJP2_9ASCO|nr:hypothetical protein DASC09_021590 [Saccharomycopsis crataegensis]
MKRSILLIICLWLFPIISAISYVPITEAPAPTSFVKRESAEEKSEKSASKAAAAASKSAAKAAESASKSAAKAAANASKSSKNASKSAAAAASKAFQAASNAAKSASISASKVSKSRADAASKSAKAESKSEANASKAESKSLAAASKSASKAVAASSKAEAKSEAKASKAAAKSKAKASKSLAKNIAYQSKVLKSMEKKVTRSVIPVVDQSEIVPDSDYVDVYECGTDYSHITTGADISTAKYGCRYSAWVGFYLNQGAIAVRNLTYLINENSTYQKNYQAYIKSIQSSIMSEFGSWLNNDQMNNMQYYRCNAAANDIWNNDQCIHKVNTAKEEVNCKGGSFKNLYIEDSKKDAAAKSLASYYNLSIKAEDLILSEGAATFNISKKKCKFKTHNMTLPSAVQLVPDPLANFTWDNLTSFADLLATANASFGKVSPIDLIDFLIPVPTYVQMAISAMQIDEEGAKDIKIEKEERKLKILRIVFAVIGVAAIFLDGFAAIAIDGILAGVQALVTWSITGTLSPEDIIFTIGSAVFSIFGAVKLGKSVDEVVNTVRFSTTSDLAAQMVKIPTYKECLESAFGVAISVPTSN